MLIARHGDYLLEATREEFHHRELPTGPAAWFSCNGRILGFAKGATVTDACTNALDEWMNDANAEHDEPTIDAWHAMRSHLIGLATGRNIQ